jgi:hypothetical protein
MPYHKNFEELYSRGEFSLQPEGWEPLEIEYGYENIGSAQYFFWRVKGTRHTFRKAVSVLNQETGGDYEEAIKGFLEGFREEIMGWVMQKPIADWAREYVAEYNKWIKI